MRSRKTNHEIDVQGKKKPRNTPWFGGGAGAAFYHEKWIGYTEDDKHLSVQFFEMLRTLRRWYIMCSHSHIIVSIEAAFILIFSFQIIKSNRWQRKGWIEPTVSRTLASSTTFMTSWKFTKVFLSSFLYGDTPVRCTRVGVLVTHTQCFCRLGILFSSFLVRFK